MLLSVTNAIQIEFGTVTAHCFGGRFRDYDPSERRLVSVKMAEEINHPHDISIPTEDFSIPDVEDMNAGMILALTHIATGKDIYAGCMGGIGRTGLFMGVLCKALMDYHGGMYKGFKDPVTMVRDRYFSHAIETKQQQEFVRGYDTSEIVAVMKYLTSLPAVLSRNGFVPSPIMDALAYASEPRLTCWQKMVLWFKKKA